jgi:dephospho-CoA kinase
VLARIDKQWSDERKKSVSDYVVMNDEKCSVLEQVLKVHNELINTD